MKKNKILYQGDTFEALWSALGYMPFMFLITIGIDKNSMFLRIHAIRSLIITILFPLINLPIFLTKLHILPQIGIIYSVYFLFAVIFTFLLLFDYAYCIYQASKGIYKKSFLVDKIFSKIINMYMRKSFFHK